MVKVTKSHLTFAEDNNFLENWIKKKHSIIYYNCDKNKSQFNKLIRIICQYKKIYCLFANNAAIGNVKSNRYKINKYLTNMKNY